MSEPTISSAPEHIHIFTLLQWKYAIRLEDLGLHHSRGSVRAHAARTLGCKRSEVKDRIEALLGAWREAHE